MNLQYTENKQYKVLLRYIVLHSESTGEMSLVITYISIVFFMLVNHVFDLNCIKASSKVHTEHSTSAINTVALYQEGLSRG